MNNQLFNSALKKFNEKNFIESKKLFEQLLSIEPKNFKAMHALGVVNGILKNHQAALSLFRQSLSLNKDLLIFNDDAPTLVVNDKLSSENHLKVDFDNLAPSLLKELHSRNIQSIIIEGGTQTLYTFIEAKVWDEARVFTSKKTLGKGIQSPLIQSVINHSEIVGNDKLTYYIN